MSRVGRCSHRPEAAVATAPALTAGENYVGARRSTADVYPFDGSRMGCWEER
jgi:hypothetical protein